MERLGLDAAPQLQHLLERCSEFWELVEGTAPGPDAGLKELMSIAPGRTFEDTFTFGVHEDGRLVAFAQLARDYPKPSQWWIGLLLVDPAKRGRGFGAELHHEIVEWVEAQSATALWLGVQTQNEAALRFWLRIGYVERERKACVASSGFLSTMILMSLPLRTTPSSPSD